MVHAELEVRSRLAFLGDAEIAGRHALDGAGLVVGASAAAKPGKIDTERLGLLGSAAHHVAQAHDDVAVVLEAIGRRKSGVCARAPVASRRGSAVLDHRLRSGAPRSRSGEQLGQRARIHDRARQDVRAGLGTLLEHDDRQLALLRGGELLSRIARAAGRPGADDDNVVLHRLARAVLGDDFFCGDVRHPGPRQAALADDSRRCSR